MTILKTSQDHEIYYEYTKNEKVTLVFIHGWVHNRNVWKKEKEFLSKKGYSVLIMDLRGFGKSTKHPNPKDYSFEHFSSDIKKVLIKEKIKEYVLIGHSMGGMIALDFIQRYKDPKALVLLDTSYENPLKYYDTRGYLTNYLKKWINNYSEKFLIKQIIQDFDFVPKSNVVIRWLKSVRHTNSAVVLGCLKAMITLDKENELKEIEAPTLLMVGEKDFLTPLPISKKMKKEIRNSQLKIIPNAPHDINLSNPEVVSKQIHSFLKKKSL